MTLRDQLDDDVANVFLQTDEFAETITYTPRGGSPRTITAVIEERTEYQDDQLETRHAETLDVLVARDSSTGIDAPRIGDAITRSTDPTAYAWTGETMDADSAAWRLTFTRRPAFQIGRDNTQ